jgi:hypothetical protein
MEKTITNAIGRPVVAKEMREAVGVFMGFGILGFVTSTGFSGHSLGIFPQD